jgi:hypothetical protein
MTEDGWIQLYVKAPEGNGYTTPQAMKRVDDHLVQSFPASMRVPPHGNGLPEQEEDGSWEVRVYHAGSAGIVRAVLIGHYGLEIVKEVRHDPPS